MRNSRVIEERETFDSAYPNTKGYDYYRNSYLQKKKKNTRLLFSSGRKDSPFRRSHFSSDFSLIISQEIAKDPVILDIKRICACVCVCHSTVIKIKFKVNDYF